jgi:hypothetical protein
MRASMSSANECGLRINQGTRTTGAIGDGEALVEDALTIGQQDGDGMVGRCLIRLEEGCRFHSMTRSERRDFAIQSPCTLNVPGETCAGTFRLKLGSAWKEQRRIDKNFTEDGRRAAQQAEGDPDLGGTYLVLRMI